MLMAEGHNWGQRPLPIVAFSRTILGHSALFCLMGISRWAIHHPNSEKWARILFKGIYPLGTAGWMSTSPCSVIGKIGLNFHLPAGGLTSSGSLFSRSANNAAPHDFARTRKSGLVKMGSGTDKWGIGSSATPTYSGTRGNKQSLAALRGIIKGAPNGRETA